MLQSIRDRAQNWIFLIIIFILVIAFAFWGMERFFEGGSVSKVAAKVNGHKITQSEFQNEYQRLKRQLQLQLGHSFIVTSKIEANLKKQALQKMIDDYVLTKAAENQGYFIGPGQVNAVLTSIPVFQRDGKFSPQRFEDVLNKLLYTQQSFVQQLRTSMLVNQLQLGLINSSFVLPTEVMTAYELINQERDVNYLIISRKRFLDSIKLNEQELQTYYNNHKKAFSNPETVKIAYLRLNLKDLMTKQHFTDKQLRNYYEGNLSNFTIPARWHVAQILIRVPKEATPKEIKQAKEKITTIENDLKQKQSFTKLAEKYSQDPITAKKGGVMPWFTEGSVSKEFFSHIKNLKVGQVSQPVRTKYGFSLFKLLDKKPEETKKFAEVKKDIEKSLAQQNAEKAFANQSDELSNLTFSDSNNLQSAAKALNLKIQTTKPFTRKGLKEGVANNPKIVNAAFSNTVLVQKYNSDPVRLSNTDMVVLRVIKHTPSSVKPFKDVKTKIISALKAKKAAAMAKKLGNEIIEKVSKGADLSTLARDNNLKLIKKDNLSRHSEAVPGSILQNIFEQPKPDANSVSIDGLTLKNGDFAVVAVTKVIPGNPKKLTSTEARVYREQLTKQQGSLDFNLYSKQTIDNAKVKIESKQ